MSERLESYGLTDRWRELFANLGEADALLGRVIRQDRGFAMVVTEDETLHVAIRPDRTGAIVVGDWVAIEDEVVMYLLERSSVLARKNVREGAEQLLVSNVDVVLIVCAADRPRTAGRIERTVAQAWDANAAPLLVLTKAELLDDVDAEVALLKGIVPLVDVVVVSAFEGTGVEEVRSAIAGKTAVMVGESGAGKSTLLNALVGEDLVATGDVRATDYKGRHTTTRRELHLLPDGGALIDTPGLRSLGLWTDTGSVDATFGDITDLADGCRFRDCAHDAEPGCAIRDAIKAGVISADRVESWRNLRKEAAAAELRKSEHERRQSERKSGRLVDEALRAKGKK